MLIKVTVSATLLIDTVKRDHRDAIADCIDDDGEVDLAALEDFIGDDFFILANLGSIESEGDGWDYTISAKHYPTSNL